LSAVAKQNPLSAAKERKSKTLLTFVCLLALLPLFATQGKQALARDRSAAKERKSKTLLTFVCLLALLPLFATQGKQALARDRSLLLVRSNTFGEIKAISCKAKPFELAKQSQPFERSQRAQPKSAAKERSQPFLSYLCLLL
jgi:hypothetical protein